ncbi:riboflavin biosynthesis protein RibF, partial [Tyzzerella sp. OttesenSCG-928-J15]|nr:riboflavin biosynthesis protein RibF [Tyzzerella sp. OttesenSCG-928-J15]
LKVDFFVEYPFDMEFSKLSGNEFVENVLKNKFNCKAIVIGSGFAFGKNRMWDANAMAEISHKSGIETYIMPHELLDGEKVSSTDIRNFIKEGNIGAANNLMGHNYFIEGVVTHGEGRGHKLGFPTINIITGNEKLLPANGVYATKTYFGGAVAQSITNVGNNITFDKVATRVETFLIDFDGDLYGKPVKIEFLKFLREERKFENANALIEQINIDIEKRKGSNDD